jgi:periplasmic protein TonB
MTDHVKQRHIMKMFKSPRANLTALGLSVASAIAAFLAGCTSTPLPPPVTVVPPPQAPMPKATSPDALPLASQAVTPRAYRRDAASHIYAKNADRIYRGKMPPLLYAIGVLQVDVDSKGRVMRTSWMRAPTQAPEVIAEIEHTVRAAAPYPAPVRMGRVTYTDTWLWHKSGTFQLDTLTEGQY